MNATGHTGSDNDPISVDVCETFRSIQGESTYAGLPCFFIRLAGCNLECDYCDTPQSRSPGKRVGLPQLVTECIEANAAIAEITGGEPLLQLGVAALAREIHAQTMRPVLIETNGTQDISVVPAEATIVMDIKTPASGMCDATDFDNVTRLRPHDEVKFVLADRRDFDWACEIVAGRRLADLCHAVLFSPVAGRLATDELARWILETGVPARLQLQLHKVLGMQ